MLSVVQGNAAAVLSRKLSRQVQSLCRSDGERSTSYHPEWVSRGLPERDRTQTSE